MEKLMVTLLGFFLTLGPLGTFLMKTLLTITTFHSKLLLP